MESVRLDDPRLVEEAPRGGESREASGVPARHAAVCPACDTTYGVPPGLLPPWGGRVRCPRCARVFAVGPLACAVQAVAAVRARDPRVFDAAVGAGELWGGAGLALLEAYERLREAEGPEVAAPAFRRAVELAVRGAWCAPPSPLNPFRCAP